MIFLSFVTSVIWYCFTKAGNVEMKGGDFVNSRVHSRLCPWWYPKMVCVTEWRNQTDNWTYPASFSVLFSCSSWSDGDWAETLLELCCLLLITFACLWPAESIRSEEGETQPVYQLLLPYYKTFFFNFNKVIIEK